MEPLEHKPQPHIGHIEHDKGLTWYERLYVPEIFRGVVVTTRHFLVNLFRDRDPNPEVVYRKGGLISTVQYPEEKVPYPVGYRGLHRLVPREDGKPRCVACFMCATVCPAQCIYIEAAEYSDDPIEKFPQKFVIDELRCIVCGLCVEACPKDAIRMDTFKHTPSELNRTGFIFPIERLLKGPQVSYPSDPWRKRPGSGQPADQHFPLHGIAQHPTEPIPAPKPEPQGIHHPPQQQFRREDFKE